MFKLMLNLGRLICWIGGKVYVPGDWMLRKGGRTSGLKGRVYRKLGCFICVDFSHWICEAGRAVIGCAPRDRRPAWLRFV